MVMDHVEFGPMAKEVPLLLLFGPPSFAWKNMTCFLNHWNYVCALVIFLTQCWVVFSQKYNELHESIAIITHLRCRPALI